MLSTPYISHFEDYKLGRTRCQCISGVMEGDNRKLVSCWEKMSPFFVSVLFEEATKSFVVREKKDESEGRGGGGGGRGRAFLLHGRRLQLRDL